MNSQNEKNKEMVREYYHLALNLRRPEEAVKKYLGPFYRQHNPGAADGADAFIAFVKGFTGALPSLRFDFKRFVAEGDLVVVHSHLIRQPGDRGVAVMDIFRIENDKIVEHWDVVQEIPEISVNTNTMF
jgi:predicted SnoaL-like aldol condensation-catalyzing enzyme